MNFTELTGLRVRLCLFTPADITTDYVGWLNDPAVVRYSNQRFLHHDVASCVAYLGTFDGTENLFLSIGLIATGTAVGTMTVYRNTRHQTADVGIMIGDRSVQGRGVGQEAWEMVIGWLLTDGGARKVTAGTLDCNAAMLKVAERSGMVRDGRRAGQELVDGIPRDIVYFAKFREPTAQ